MANRRWRRRGANEALLRLINPKASAQNEFRRVAGYDRRSYSRSAVSAGLLGRAASQARDTGEKVAGQKVELSGPTLTYRNALADLTHSPADIRAEGSDLTPPLVTIAITVYKRFEYLVGAVQSALNQDFLQPIEIIVVDDDPNSDFAEALLQRLPVLRGRSFRYIVNRQNLGVNGTFNRCIEYARGEWVSILNDDDLLERNFLSTMFAEIFRNPAIDGLASRKRDLDERGPIQQAQRSLPRRIFARLLQEALFSGRATRAVNERKMFWWPGGVVGNCAGLLLRTDAARRVGGFYPEEGPSGDYWFLTRFARRAELRQHRAVLASVRISRNESAKVSTLKNFIAMTYKLQQALAGAGTPRWWRRFSPMIIARQRAFYRDYWRIDIPEQEVEELLNIKLPPDRPVLFRVARLIFRGF